MVAPSSTLPVAFDKVWTEPYVKAAAGFSLKIPGLHVHAHNVLLHVDCNMFRKDLQKYCIN